MAWHQQSQGKASNYMGNRLPSKARVCDFAYTQAYLAYLWLNSLSGLIDQRAPPQRTHIQHIKTCTLMHTCFAPISMGIKHSGSAACVASSIRTCWKRKPLSRASPAPTHVQHTTCVYM
eukprot:scaffold100608_cov17-Tisochrysis_lutea.AAC.1